MDFFQHKAYLHARVPRVRCAEHGVRQVRLSWARPESGFTLLFEALLITLAAAMPVARLTSEPVAPAAASAARQLMSSGRHIRPHSPGRNGW
jgi:hypothetical protein